MDMSCSKEEAVSVLRKDGYRCSYGVIQSETGKVKKSL